MSRKYTWFEKLARKNKILAKVLATFIIVLVYVIGAPLGMLFETFIQLKRAWNAFSFREIGRQYLGLFDSHKEFMEDIDRVVDEQIRDELENVNEEFKNV